MGMVFQHFALLPHLTVLQNVAFPLEVPGAGRAQRDARAREVIVLLGLNGRTPYYPPELSGGPHDPVARARSLALGPGHRVLTGPFAALALALRRQTTKQH